jgi:hypothetical protein
MGKAEGRISEERLMHVKYIHELYSLLGHIILYLIVYWRTEYVFHWFQGFSKEYSLFWFEFSRIGNTIFAFEFRGLSERQTDLIFLVHHFFKKTKIMRRKSQHKAPRGRKKDLPCGPHSWQPFLISLPLRNCLDLKPTLYTNPCTFFCSGAVEKHKIHETDMKSTGIGEETLPEPLPVAPSPPSISSPTSTWWIGSSSSLNYGIVEVTCINLFIVLY